MTLRTKVSAKGLPWNPTAWTLDNEYIAFFGTKGVNWESPDGWLSIRDGVWTVRAGYRWDGNSCVPDFLNRLDPITRKPKTYYSSLCHDIGYRYLRLCPDWFPYTKIQVDYFFFRLMRQSRFRLAWLYYVGVRIFGRFCL